MWAIDHYYTKMIRNFGFNLEPNKTFLDIGCGDGNFTKYLTNKYSLHSIGIDAIPHDNWYVISNDRLQFKKASIYELPFGDKMFDYVLLKDILHHIDEPRHSHTRIKLAFDEVKRICKSNAIIMILESNRYNPISYISMVKIRKHDHFRHKNLMKLVHDNFSTYKFQNFEAHVYPASLLPVGKLYENIMDYVINGKFRSYTLFTIENAV